MEGQVLLDGWRSSDASCVSLAHDGHGEKTSSCWKMPDGAGSCAIFRMYGKAISSSAGGQVVALPNGEAEMV